MRAEATLESISFETTHPAAPSPPFRVNHPPFLDRKTPTESYDSPTLADTITDRRTHVHIHMHLRLRINTHTRVRARARA